MTVKFKFYVKTTNNRSIELTRKYLEFFFIELYLLKDEYGLQIHFVKVTVYRLMRKNGASYSTAKKCYYTDRHDTRFDHTTTAIFDLGTTINFLTPVPLSAQSCRPVDASVQGLQDFLS